MSAEEKVLVVPTSSFPLFVGFLPLSRLPLSMLLENKIWMKRTQAETDIRYKQLIPVGIITDPKRSKVFCYQRASTSSYQEVRLRGRTGITVGGHLNPTDGIPQKPESIVWNGLERELREEVTLQNAREVPICELLGYINSEDTEVDRVHLGILFHVIVDADDVLPRDPEIKSGRMVPLDEIERMFLPPDSLAESWARIAFGTLRLP